MPRSLRRKATSCQLLGSSKSKNPERSSNCLRIRPAITADIPATIALEQKCPTAAHWTHRQYELALAAPESGGSQRLALVVDGELEAGSVSEGRKTPELFAFLIAHHLGPEWELENLVVSPSARRKGLGSGLIKELLSQARKAGDEHVFLEVRESNHAARVLYEKLGFAETGRRKAYYRNPPDDAILYRWKPR